MSAKTPAGAPRGGKRLPPFQGRPSLAGIARRVEWISATGDNFRAAYARVDEAEKLFANGQYKQVLTALRLSFEALAISLGFEKRVRECFESLFADTHPEKKEKAREALTGLYKFLHLGPHEQAEGSETVAQPGVLRRDARFALTMAHAVFEYITPQV